MIKEYISKLKVKRMVKKGKRKLQKTFRNHKKAMKRLEKEAERIKLEEENKELRKRFDNAYREIARRENRKESDNWGPKFFGPL